MPNDESHKYKLEGFGMRLVCMVDVVNDEIGKMIHCCMKDEEGEMRICDMCMARTEEGAWERGVKIGKRRNEGMVLF